MKKLLLFVLAYFIITMAWAYPWHVIWFHEVYKNLGVITRETPIVPLGIIAVLLQGICFGYLYSFYEKAVSGNPILKGIKFNLIAGILVYTAMSFATAAKVKIEPVSTFLIYHTVFQVIQFVLTGIALGLIYRKKPN